MADTLRWTDQKALDPAIFVTNKHFMGYHVWHSVMAEELVTGVRYSTPDGWEVYVGNQGWQHAPGDMTLDEAKALAIVLNRMGG